jgi:hypothetical protein
MLIGREKHGRPPVGVDLAFAPRITPSKEIGRSPRLAVNTNKHASNSVQSNIILMLQPAYMSVATKARLRNE